jgi:SAM-dependent methyltransferase
MDLAAGTGLISKLLIEYIHISPTSLYLVEPAERMCIRARDNIKTPHIYQTAAEDCLSTANLPRDYFDFILCNASMHLMSETDIYPIVSKLLKPKTGYFLYTLWYHAFDETENYNRDEEFETYVNDALTYFNYPKYFATKNNAISTTKRSRNYLEKTALNNGLKLESCTIDIHRTPMDFDLDFMLMSPNWLLEHLKTYEWTQKEDNHSMKECIIEKVRELIKEKYNEIPVVQIIVSRV